LILVLLFWKSSVGFRGTKENKLLSGSGVCSLFESTKSLQKPDQVTLTVPFIPATYNQNRNMRLFAGFFCRAAWRMNLRILADLVTPF
jgi:hypothetical protein